MEQLAAPATSARSGHTHGLLKAWRYDKVGELRASRHSLQGDKGHSYDATGRILQTQHGALGSIRSPLPQAANESFGYDPAGNIQDSTTQQAVQSSTALSQRGYVRDNLVRVFEDKRYFYDGHGRLIRKLAGKHTDQGFAWDEENNLTQVTTTRRPGTEHATTQTTTFDYDAIGRRVAKHDAFGTTVFIWEGMRLIEERRGQSVISYVYEPGSYVPLARLDAQGQATEQGGLGITQDVELKNTPETIATSACHISAGGKKYHQSQQPPANDAEAQYWEALDTQTGTAQKTGTEAKLCDVYYFHTDQAGLPQELTNAQGQLVWQANYKTWGSTVSEEWEVKSLAGQQVHSLDQGDIPTQEDGKQQNLRFQGQYLDRETGLHYNTFRYYDADIGRFICPDPIGLGGGINLGSYSPNPLSWIDPWGWACKSAFSGRRGTAKARHDLERNGYKVVGEEVTMMVNGNRVRADLVAKDGHGNFHVFEVKHGSGGLTPNQTGAGVYNMKSPSNTLGGVGGGTIKSGQGTSGKFKVATGNKQKTAAIGKRGTERDATFHVLKY